jgi:DUF4097 and DUF4098 domain-containing protein YvlB
MPTFATPGPVSLAIELMAGGVRVEASERSDTVVEITPRDPANDNDNEAAAHTRVDFADLTLTIKTGKRWQAMFTNKVATVDVVVRVPAGSQLRGSTHLGDLHCLGPLGACQFKTSLGDIAVAEAESAYLTTMMGPVTIDTVAGDCHITGTGKIGVGRIGGTASIKNLNGDTWVGEVAGDLSLKSANGNIVIDHPGANVNARTAYGSVHIGDIVRGSVEMQSAAGRLEIGIRQGTSAWLDVKSSAGVVRNQLDSTDQPEREAQTAQIRARTYSGDIVIRRATTAEEKKP